MTHEPAHFTGATLSASGRRSHLLLLLYSATESCSLAHRCGTEPDTVQSDLAQLEAEISTLCRLALLCREGSYRIEGNVLNHRLCLFDSLHRALRLCPDRVERDFTAMLTHQWRDLPPALQIPPAQLAEALTRLLPLLPDQRTESNRQFLSLSGCVTCSYNAIGGNCLSLISTSGNGLSKSRYILRYGKPFTTGPCRPANCSG